MRIDPRVNAAPLQADFARRAGRDGLAAHARRLGVGTSKLTRAVAGLEAVKEKERRRFAT